MVYLDITAEEKAKALSLSEQRHTACKLIDLFLWAAHCNTEILQGILRRMTHLLNKFVIGLAALGQIGEVHHRQILKVRLVEFFAYLFDDFQLFAYVDIIPNGNSAGL